MVTGDATVMPWAERQVLQLPERDGWVLWAAGLDPEGWGAVAALVPGGENDDATIAAVRALDEQVVADGEAWGAGIWFPAKEGHQAAAGLMVRTYPDRGDLGKAYARFVKGARKVPKVPGVTLSSYDMAEGEVDLGRFVEQVIDSVDAESGGLTCRWRYTFFPEVKDEVVVLEFDTVYPHLVDVIEEEITALIEHAYYGVKGAE